SWITKQTIAYSIPLISVEAFFMLYPTVIFLVVASSQRTFIITVATILFIILILTTCFVIYFLLSLQIKNFHFQFEDKFISLKQGVFVKQERHIPYSVIQNFYISSDFLDRLFKLSNIIVENASNEGGIYEFQSKDRFPYHKRPFGFHGNHIRIPGLSSENAEKLKIYLLQKIKENPTNPSLVL
ncbi:PH domain-containing protein, partial [Patescibacteria group bacterium]|nr:PH domain-containing protein [Patescibacteria group bacterium]